MMKGIELVSEVDCFDLCDILRLHLTTYHDYPVNVYEMKMELGIFMAVYAILMHKQIK